MGLGIVLPGLVYILALYTQSLYYQRIEFRESSANEFRHPASFFLNGFPPIPDVSNIGKPVVSCKARYLIEEGRYTEAVSLLTADHSSPYDGRPEFMTAYAYDKLGKSDSALIWAKKAYQLKPGIMDHAEFLCLHLFNSGRKEEGLKIIEEYLSKVKTREHPWIFAADLKWQAGLHKEAVQLLDSALVYLPGNPSVLQKQKQYKRIFKIEPYAELFDRAKKAYDVDHNIPETLRLLNEFIAKKPEAEEAYLSRAICYYRLHDFNNSLKDIARIIDKQPENLSFLMNLRGVNFRELGKPDLACSCFKYSMVLGNKEAEKNYNELCGSIPGKKSGN